MTLRPALLVSVSRLPSARAVWQHRAVFGPGTPEFHLVDSSGRFLTASEAGIAGGAPEGLDYDGTFFDALQQRRLSTVFPLLARTDGAVQGLLEFVGVPYAGCGMTSAILADDPHRGRAVLASLGLGKAPPGANSDVTVAVLGNEDPLVGKVGVPAAEDFCRRVYRGLGLSGWALIGASRVGDGWGWTEVEVQPDLGPGSPFLVSLETLGLGLGAVLDRVLKWGLIRHDAEFGLKSLFKDKI